MNEFVEKLIGRLEEARQHELIFGYGERAYFKAISIVNQIAEEYNKNIEKSYISRTEVLKLIEDIKCNDSVPKNYGTLLDIMRQIRSMPTVSINNGWIPCSERLPEEGKKVLTCTEDGWISVNINMPYNGRKNDFQCGYYVAWMPLPEPFKPIAE